MDVGEKYGVQEFHEFLKVVSRYCGLRVLPAMMLFQDRDVVEDSFGAELYNTSKSGHVLRFNT